jgi:putative membrane protein
MRQVQNIVIIFLSILTLVNCESARKQDSQEVAEEKNEKNFDTREGEKEAAFVANAIQENLAEIKLAELASTRSSNRQVQAVAQEMVSDHADSNLKLRELASKKGISVPVEEGEEAKEKVNKLAKETQPDFDKKWCDELVDKHEKTIRDFEAMQQRSEDPELKELINATLPELRSHLEKLTALEKDML